MWRAWRRRPVDAGPSKVGAIAARRPVAVCGTVGPFPFADGSLQILSSDLMFAFVALAHQLQLLASLSRGPSFWTHEDAAVGYLIPLGDLAILPLTYVVLSPWKHNKFWINWFRNNHSLPMGAW